MTTGDVADPPEGRQDGETAGSAADTSATARRSDDADYSIEVVRLPNGTTRWPLVHDFLVLRRKVFIEEMRWELNSAEGMEYEQYDSLDAVYLIAHREGEVLGGARLLRTDRELGTGRLRYSYMIRDAYHGHLPGLPSDLCETEPPRRKTAWELTRLAVRNARLGPALLQAANEFLKSVEADTCLFLGFPAFLRMAKRMGYDPRPLGKMSGNQDGQFLAFSCGVI